ncbi:MAG: hypothetical protein ABJ000_19195, partial [Saccharospirillum sp.]
MPQNSQSLPSAFVLSRHWSENDQGIQLRYWLKTADQVQCWQVANQRSVCFIPVAERAAWGRVWSAFGSVPEVGDAELRLLSGEPVVPVYSLQ